MSGVARLVAKIETEMGVEVEQGDAEAPAAEAVGVNPEHLRMMEALLFAASLQPFPEAARRSNRGAGRQRWPCVGASFCMVAMTLSNPNSCAQNMGPPL